MSGTPSTIRQIRLAAALTYYRYNVSILKKGYKQECYRINTLSRSVLANRYVHEIRSTDIAAYRDERLQTINPKTKKPLSPATVRLEMSLLSHFFDLARIEWGYTDQPNPCQWVRKPKLPPGRSRRLSPREERHILRYAKQHRNAELYPIIVLALETAMRQGEILSLQWEHIDFSRRVAHLVDTKNGESRDVPLSMSARRVLTQLGVKSSGPVFSYTSGGIKSTWRYMMQFLNIEDLHFHDLRHEATSRLFELSTLNTMEVAAITGHKSLSMLKRYTHLKVSHLAHKLDGNRNQGKAALLKSFVPYPCLIQPLPQSDPLLPPAFTVTFPDFSHKPYEVTLPPNSVTIEQHSQRLLSQLLLRYIASGKKVPRPDQYSHLITEPTIMVDPLACLLDEFPS